MSVRIKVAWDKGAVTALRRGPMTGAIKRALRKAASTALRDMRSEATKRIRRRKRLKISAIREALHMRLPKGDPMAADIALDVTGKRVPLLAYPHRATKRGISVEVNRGKRTLVKGAFLATMSTGHRGIFRRVEKRRLPIREMIGSRPVDALLHEGEGQGVADRGGKSFAETFERLLPLEIAKGK